MVYLTETIDWKTGKSRKVAFIELELFDKVIEFLKTEINKCDKVCFVTTESPSYLEDQFKKHDFFKNWELNREKMSTGEQYVWEKKKAGDNEKVVEKVEKQLKDNNIKYLLVSQDEDNVWLRFSIDSGVKNSHGFIDNCLYVLAEWVKKSLNVLSYRMLVINKLKNKVIVDSDS